MTGFAAPTLVAPQAGEAGAGAQLEKLCTLPLRYRERLVVTLLGRHLISHGIQQIASYPMQLGLAVPFLGRLDYPRNLGEALQSFVRLSELSVGLGEHRERTRRICNTFGSMFCRQRLREKRESFHCLPERGQRRSAEYRCPTNV